MVYLSIGAGGFLGAMVRYALGQIIDHYWTGNYPLGTFLINLAGCFFLGLFLTLCNEWPLVSPPLRLGVATGFTGALTTFSTYTYEVLGLVDRTLILEAILYTSFSVLLGLSAVWLGTIISARLLKGFPIKARSH
ncbi:MAG: fluoride efflux transporter CrcB [Bacillota bacterium]